MEKTNATLVPFVKKSDFRSPLSDDHLIQLIGHSERRNPNFEISQDQISLMNSNKEFCALFTEEYFHIESYSLLNYYIELYVTDEYKERYQNLIDGLEERNLLSAVKYLEEGKKFYSLHIDEIQYLGKSSSDFESRYDKLESKLKIEGSLYSALYKLSDGIEENPKNYCIDENGYQME